MSLFNIEIDSTSGKLKVVAPKIDIPTPPPLPPKKKFRIAVCFSGQPRYWQESLANIKRFFEHEYPHPELGLDVETDYFIHTWDTNSWRLPKTDHNVFEDIKHSDDEAIKEAYSPKGIIIEEYNKDRFIPRAFDPMFYSFARSMMLKREYELQHSFQYDLVIKARLDVIYNPANKFPLQRVWPGVCYTSTPISKFASEFNYNNFDDVLFYGDSPTMDLVGDLYDTHNVEKPMTYQIKNQAGLNLDTTLWYGPGCLLYKYMTKLSIHPDGSRPFEYAVMRSTAVDAKLDSVYNYDEIRSKWFEWYI
jgi:hypothetical protein